ncbi:hypothetical protein [Tropheryma whipplei]|uniref:hypothetical protein n=1 Tax=Tropheryma whipplei TaxID=2039 RepID=UPI0004B6FC16|nr:hypothetical protein [Tropheryma whipplei]
MDLPELSHRVDILAVTGLVMLVTQLFIVVSPVLVDFRTLLARTSRESGNQAVRGFTTLSRTARVVVLCVYCAGIYPFGMFSKRKCGYLEDLSELSELSHRVAISGIRQIRDVAVFIFSGFIFSLFILSLTDLRGWSCSGDFGVPRLTRFLPLVLAVALPVARAWFHWC